MPPKQRSSLESGQEIADARQRPERQGRERRAPRSCGLTLARKGSLSEQTPATETGSRAGAAVRVTMPGPCFRGRSPAGRSVSRPGLLGVVDRVSTFDLSPGRVEPRKGCEGEASLIFIPHGQSQPGDATPDAIP